MIKKQNKNNWLETDRCFWPSIACLSCRRYLCINRYNSVNVFIFKYNSNNYLHFALSSSSLLSSPQSSCQHQEIQMLQWCVCEMRRPRHKQIQSVKGSWIAAIGAGGLLPEISSKAVLSPNEICMELYEGASQPTSLYKRIPPPSRSGASGDVLRSRHVPALWLASLTSCFVV